MAQRTEIQHPNLNNSGLVSTPASPSSEHMEQMQECITAALKTTNDIAIGDMARVQRSLAKFGTPRSPKTPEQE